MSTAALGWKASQGLTSLNSGPTASCSQSADGLLNWPDALSPRHSHPGPYRQAAPAGEQLTGSHRSPAPTSAVTSSFLSHPMSPRIRPGEDRVACPLGKDF